MDWKRAGAAVGITAGVFLGMKYIFPIILPFLCGWLLAEAVYPPADILSRKRICRKLHFTRNGIGAAIILSLVLFLFILIFTGTEYLADKVCGGIRYYPVLQEKFREIVERCCMSVEHMTGISAGKSGAYLNGQLRLAGEYLKGKGTGLETALTSVKGCVSAAGKAAVTLISSVLFLQERENIREFAESRRFLRRAKELGGEFLKGGKEYLKAQMKMFGIITVLCTVGLWILRIKHFLFLGIVIGVLDMFPILGTGTFLIPAGIFYLIWHDLYRGIGFLVLYVFTAGTRQFLEPRLVGEHVGIPPLLVLFSVYTGVIVYGGSGFILGPLSGMLLYIILKKV